MVAFTEQSSLLLRVRLLSPNQGVLLSRAHGAAFSCQGTQRGPRGPEIGPLNLGRSEGDQLSMGIQL
jgi:hypothetical protein